MDVLPEALAWGAGVSGPLLVGAVAAAILPLWERVATTLTTIGGGILIGALAFDLVPEADRHAGAWLTAGGLVAGTLLFLGLDWLVSHGEEHRELRRAMQAGASRGRLAGEAGEEAAGRGKTIALGIFVDGVPETAALGITIAEGEIGLALLVGIVVSNLTESYGSSEAIVTAGYSRRYPILLFAGIGLALLGAIVVGATLLAGTSDTVIGTAEAVAGGAIFATVLIAIIPHAFAEVSRWAAVAAVAGLVVGYLLS
jgi:zinc transporter, ZIP family